MHINRKTRRRERPLKTINTIKELNILSEDAWKEYNVYRNFILVPLRNNNEKTGLAYDEEMQILSRQLVEGIIDETQYMNFGNKFLNEYEYRNITTTVKGLYKIKEVIKDNLDYFMSLPYITNIDIVQVVINK